MICRRCRACSGPYNLDMPDWMATFPTATATLSDTSRILLTSGYTRPASRSSWVRELTTAMDAWYSMSSVICLMLRTAAARPMPGNRNMLLHWEGFLTVPSSIVTWPKGEPEAKIAWPFVHLKAFSAVTSALAVGFESGKMNGLSLCTSISSHTSWVKIPAVAERPRRRVGLNSLITSTRLMPSFRSLRQKRDCWWLREAARDLVRGPMLSISTKFACAWSAVRPCFIMPCASIIATPHPALPAPATRMRWCERASGVSPLLTSPLMTPARVTAPVPWMSSLKQHTGSRPCARVEQRSSR
mmetsp:Transcript_67741/g.161694  ORF Transcript_67741/g.161694 Transcript_67741/m.161694 type:complete len:300 (-) Transcript_67741:930-1829(-)